MPALRKTITAAHVQNAKGGTRKGEEPAGCRRYESGTAALKDGGYTRASKAQRTRDTRDPRDESG